MPTIDPLPTTASRVRAADRGRRGLVVRRRRPGRRADRQGGIAILAVVTAIAIALMIVNEFGSRTTIDMLQSRNTLDQTRAHFLARSAVNLGELMLRMQKTLDKLTETPPGGKPGILSTVIPPGTSILEMSDLLMAAFGGDAEQVQQAIGVNSLDDVKGMGADIGQFGLHVVPVDGKINVNCAYTAGADRKLVAGMLKSLFFPFATNSIFDEEDAEGWRRDYETQVEAIIDYIDGNQSKVDVAERPGSGSGSAALTLTEGGTEDYGYENLRDRYKPKDHRIDSVGELRLVRGMDDRMWTLFGGAFRVNGDCKISLKAMDDATVIQAVISLSAKDPFDPFLKEQRNIWIMSSLVLQARAMGMAQTTQDFIAFVKDPAAEFAANFQAAADANVPTPTPTGPVPQNFTGLELDPAKLNQFLTDKPPRAYQIEAYGDVARNPPLQPLRRTIRGTWDQQVKINNQRWQGRPTMGAWQWLREE